MKSFATVTAAAIILSTPLALAQSTPPPAEPGAAVPTPSVIAPTTTARDDVAAAPSGEGLKAWVDKPIYSSDDKNIGEVAAMSVSPTGQLIELQADIGGFLGIGETRVRVKPSEFTFAKDRVVLNITAEQAKNLPQLEMPANSKAD